MADARPVQFLLAVHVSDIAEISVHLVISLSRSESCFVFDSSNSQANAPSLEIGIFYKRNPTISTLVGMPSPVDMEFLSSFVLKQTLKTP